MIGIVGTAILVPMIYLLAIGTSDPEGVVDGVVRLCWFMPLVWIGGVALEAKGKIGSFKGVMQLHLPLVISLTLVCFFMFGWRNAGAEIVFDPRPDGRTEALRRSRGEAAFVQRRIPLVGPLGHWAHNALPPHPLPIGRE